MSRQTVLAARTEDERPDTTEIRALAEAAGHEVVAELTQSRPENPTYDLGPGKVDEVAETVTEHDADAVIVDNRLSPSQLFELTDKLSDGVEVRDRYRLILDIFESGAHTRRATLQVELARLRHELHRRREEQRNNDEFQGLQTIRDPEGEWVREVKQRIDRVRNKLNGLPDGEDGSRDRKREAGFDFVALAGYTNAGKSTLLHRLADDLTVDAAGASHDDVADTAAVEDRLFKTLDTTTRRATVDGRKVLVSDTVGFIRDLPHDLVEAFRSTLTDVREADVVVLVADASQPVDTLRDHVETCLSEVGESEVVSAFNKADLLDDDELAERVQAVSDLCPDPVAVSATENAGLDELREEVVAALPAEHETLQVPHGDEAMQFVAWCHDHAAVERVEYDDDVRIELRGRPTVVEQARARAEALR